MDRQQRIPLWILIGLQVGCLAMLIAGFICLISPAWYPAGFIGWWDGYDAKADVLGIVWLAGTLGSIFIGIVLIGGAGATAIWIGFVAGIVGLVMTKTAKAPEGDSNAAS